jgi:hypothetical protein
MDKLANKTAYGSAEWRRARSGARQGLAGLGLLLLAYPLYEARDFIAGLATTRVVATAILYTRNEGTEVQLQRAFAAAKMHSPAEATFESERNSTRHGTYYISVTANTSERAKADLATLADAIRATFPSAESNLLVSLNNSTTPTPNGLSRGISFGVQAAVVLMMLACQLLLVIGAHREGMGRAGLFAAMATPFTLLIYPSGSTGRGPASHYALSTADWNFVLLLLALTPVSVIVSLWLTRKSRQAVGRRGRA